MIRVIEPLDQEASECAMQSLRIFIESSTAELNTAILALLGMSLVVLKTCVSSLSVMPCC